MEILEEKKWGFLGEKMENLGGKLGILKGKI